MDISINSAVKGRLVFELFYKHVPRTTLNFKSLCEGYTNEHGEHLTYKGAPFHRVIPGFVVQGGDIVNKDGTGNTSIFGDSFADENFEFKHESPGTLSMANNGPDSNGSQFFVTTSEAPFLDFKHVAFGRLIEGNKVLNQIEQHGSVTGETGADILIADCGVLNQ